MNKSTSSFSYEEAFQRLEKILTALNEGNASLDQSLKLFEEANSLIENCSKQLTTAERRIETLIKNRNQELQLDETGAPQTQEFEPSTQNQLNPQTGELT